MLNTRKIGLLLLVGTVITPLTLCAKEKNSVSYCCIIDAIDVIENYYINFEILAKSEKWKEIISQGAIALEAAKNANRPHDEAKICAQLTSTAFYLGDYTQALMYASHCHELSEELLQIIEHLLVN